MEFHLEATDGKARSGKLAFQRGTVETPAFMPVGTYGTVKGMLPRMIVWSNQTAAEPSNAPKVCM